MFTGIVEELGTVRAVEDQGDAVRLTVEGNLVVSDAVAGDSLAVNGCCLTVVTHTDAEFTADVMRETLEKTAIGALRPGDRVNLERAVTAGSRLGGHIVQGHVDGVGWIKDRRPSDHWDVLTFSLDPALARLLVPKGSVTVDGVSLTVVDVGPDSFTVSLIPETLARTTLGIKNIGQPVNVEVDVIAKYVERLVGPHVQGQGTGDSGQEE